MILIKVVVINDKHKDDNHDDNNDNNHNPDNV